MSQVAATPRRTGWAPWFVLNLLQLGRRRRPRDAMESEFRMSKGLIENQREMAAVHHNAKAHHTSFYDNLRLVWWFAARHNSVLRGGNIDKNRSVEEVFQRSKGGMHGPFVVLNDQHHPGLCYLCCTRSGGFGCRTILLEH